MKRLLNATGAVVLILMAIAFAGSEKNGQKPIADLVLLNGTVITVDASDRVAEAVAVRDGKIIAVGSTPEMKSLIGPDTQRIDLHGFTVTPGLLDAHAHFSPGQFNRPGILDLSYPNVKSIQDVQAAVAERAKNTVVNKWIQGRGWDEGKLDERRLITARDLDEITPDHPVWLSHTMGHYGAANSVALRLAKITRDTPDPPGGTIDRYPDGTPTGVLKETAQSLIEDLIPPLAPAEIEDGIRLMAGKFNAEGMTGVKDPGISDEIWVSYRHVLTAGDLNVRVFVLWQGGWTEEWAKEVIAKRAAMTRPYVTTGDDHLIAGGVKMYADGSGGARTAWVYDDWNRNVTDVDDGNRGYPTADPGLLRKMIRMYHDAGMHVGTHAVGDRTIDLVVDSYVEAMRENPKKGLRHSIIHCNIPTEHALKAMAELQRDFDAGYPEPSATFTWWIGDTYAGNFGPRAKRLNPFATYQKRGIIWANGSDYSVTPYAAKYGIWASIARRPMLGVYGGDPFGRDEAVDVKAALRSMTIWAAHQMFLEKKIGSIETGKYADLAVWDRNPYVIPKDELKEMRCQLTVFNGRVVYRLPDTTLK